MKTKNDWRAWMPLWWNRLMGSAKVQAMPPAHRWYYLMLLRAQWESPTCRIPDDDEFLALVSGAGSDWPSAASSIRRCFALVDGYLVNAFCKAEWDLAKKRTIARSRNGAKGGRPKKTIELHANSEKANRKLKKAEVSPEKAKQSSHNHNHNHNHNHIEEEERETTSLSSKPDGFDLTADLPLQEKQAEPSNAKEAQCIQRLWTKYLAATRRNGNVVTLTNSRKNKGLARLRECLRKTGGDLERAEVLMEIAIERLAASDWHMGRNEKTGGKRYCEWEAHLFPNAEKLEWWLADEREEIA